MTSQLNEPIAVVGIGCRFPGGVNHPSKLWDLISSPRDVAQTIPLDRFNIDRFYHKDGTHHGTTNARESYFLQDDVTKFDNKFFAIPPAEAEAIDPQQRILLEVVYEALENAGIPMHQLSNSDTGVYVGMMSADYYTIQAHDMNALPTYAATGIVSSNASSRISYFFNWHGPSLTIDTACSSSLVGVYEAVQALRSGRCRTTAACGTNLILSPFPYIKGSNLGMLSPTGRCRMWDAAADGYARGEGVACIMLKTLSSALMDGDKIECVIREVGVNHDGKTTGLTMPSAAAQAALIRSVYRQAGLDPTHKEDRCQYFEAHGTGTPAGDPQEASALYKAFFSGETDSIPVEEPGADDVLLVGSIKTVIGHTEGTAGLAGLIKACLVLQAGVVPPNMLFDTLNPALDAFKDRLQVPTELQAWPEVAVGQPRRASVNSFGFGGTNAHAILETFIPPERPEMDGDMVNKFHETNGNCKGNGSYEANGVYEAKPACTIPIVLSAASEASLATTVRSTLAYLENLLQVRGERCQSTLASLAWTLSSRRSALSQRLSVPASSLEDLHARLRAKLVPAVSPTDEALLPAIEEDLKPVDEKLGIASLSAPPSILGIFTGQGAQWPQMGMELIKTIPMARAILSRLDASLMSLPTLHRPQWTLVEQLGAEKSTSRVSEAAFSQPLCTAVQIILVDLLQLAGIRFQAVVGHSSGEIAAAYAAGYISSTDAIRIAYYRGFFANLAGGAAGQQGAMIAVATSIEEAAEICSLEDFDGSLVVACHNSPTSVTLSGDHEAVLRAMEVFKDKGKFARVLRVDTAYHSGHMMPCAAEYREALAKCGIQTLQPDANNAPLWFSSVFEDSRVMSTSEDGLDGEYWVDNMTKPVLLCSALRAATTTFQEHKGAELNVNMVIEIGPHAALRGPASETIMEDKGQDIPYTGTLKRNTHDVESLADTLGYLWAHFGPVHVQLGNFQKATSSKPWGAALDTVYDLPQYAWDHERSLWAESRSSKVFRTHKGKLHDLLGQRTTDGSSSEWRWKNVLRIKEIGWLSGHQLQGQTVLAATVYIALGIEAGVDMSQGRTVTKIELLDLDIKKAISLNDTNGTELIVSLTNVKDDKSSLIVGDYSVFSNASKESTQMALNCTGRLQILLSQKVEHQFAARVQPVRELTHVDVDRFYDTLKEDLGYGYSGPFRALTKLSRRFGFSTATIKNTSFEDGETPLTFHPAMLDCALQGLFAAFGAPGDGSLWSVMVPAHFHRITLIPELCGTAITEFVNMDCFLTNPDPNNITGDIDVYSSGYGTQMLEIEGVRLAPFAPATSNNDRHLFQEPFFCLNDPDANLEVYRGLASSEIKKLKQRGIDAERAAFFYLKNLHLSISRAQRVVLPWYRKALIDNAESVYNAVEAGDLAHAPKAWIQDTHSEIVAMMDSYGDDDEFNLARAVGEHLLLPQVLSGKSSILEYMTNNDSLDRYYINGVGFKALNNLVATVMQQLSHKYPHMDMLEIGAGTGGATRAIFRAIASAFRSYTYTDISSGFFEKASEKFSMQCPKMLFKVLDIEHDPVGQGYAPHSYDVIVASNVLHATPSMKKTLENAKKLLKPGGYLVLLEVIRSDVMRHGLVMGGLPGWWIGVGEGRTTGPSLTLDEWDAVLRQTGFSGLETTSPMTDIVTVPGAVMVSRALDDRVSRLTSPLAATPPATAYGPLVIIGGSGDVTGRLVQELRGLLRGYFEHITVVRRLEEWSSDLPKADLNVICLSELDTNMFEAMTKPRWDAFKSLLDSAKTMLWLLNQSQDGNAHAGTTMGLFRSLFHELPGTLLQTLDLQKGVNIQASQIAELLVRLTLQAQMIKLGEAGSILFGYEPELVLHPDQKFHVPRVRQCLDQNARYNSAKREIQRSVEIDKSIIELVKREQGGSEQLASGNAYVLRETQSIRQDPLAAKRSAQADDHDEFDSGDDSESGDVDMVTIKVSCSFLSSIKTPCGYYFVQLGTDTATGHKLLFFSDSHTSVVTVPRSFTVRASNGGADDEIVDGQYMSFVVAELVMQQVLQLLPASGTVLVYEPDPILSSLLTERVADMGARVVFVSSKPAMKNMFGWTYLHQNSPQRVVDRSISARETTLYIDASDFRTSAGFSSTSSQTHGLEIRISKALSPLCDKIRLSNMTASTASRLRFSAAPSVIVKLLRKLSSFATSQISAMAIGAPLEMLPLKQIIGLASPPSPYVLVYWRHDHVVPVSTETVLRRRDLFRSDRTYWLAGLGGDIGRSLADFMVAHGARNVVISSRSPLVNEKWVQWYEERGAKIVHHACDLTSFKSTKALHARLVQTMPPIDGVANGAMVLRDGSVATMSYESLMTALNSKVQSTINLDRLLSARVLDWFVGFSSIVGTTGNAGQAAYSAGNVFMKATVRKRRARGLAGSTIDICRVVGLGYIERESSGRLTREHQARLATRSGSLAMGELDMHQLFAEAIISGRPDSGLNPEIITGLAPLSVEEAKDAFWVEHPRFGLIVQDEGTGVVGQGGDAAKTNSMSVWRLLEGAKSTQDVTRILLTAFKTRLRALMFLSASDDLSETTPLVDLGLDSLVAVEMRSWFLKELATDVPVMKILGGASISELVAGMMEKLPEDMTNGMREVDDGFEFQS